ncbi:hypothetical protein PVAND_009331 [Polypedilum vanderplanki]|uniref:Uncharacterized protein n=1 Tax=Polypedilum vanderplanki TaxID=319348 RepID=A0A9J6CCA5_POLVA|nr:hypothetical protein PVAND_009331 [Polypedilum vanderplanki]
MEKCHNKKYILTKVDDNYENFLKGLGFNYVIRRFAMSLSPTTQLLKLNNEEYKLITTTSFLTHSVTFKDGEEFEYQTVEGRKVKSVFTIKGNKIIEEQNEGNKKVTLIKEFKDTELLTEMSVNQITTKLKSILIE